MPLFYTHNINGSIRLAVWKIEEDESFFRALVSPQNNVSHPHKRLQHLAGRYLLKVLDRQFPVEDIQIAGKRPFLNPPAYHFSISHCGPFAAAIISKKIPVGIDVEIVTEKLERLENKFLGESERALVKGGCFKNPLEGLTAAWSAKESLFKWYALGQVDFKKDMHIDEVLCFDEIITMRATFKKDLEKALEVRTRFFENLCLTWVTGE